MSMVGELNFFIGLQVKQTDVEIFISQSKYAKNLVHKFGLDTSKHEKTPMAITLKLTRDETGIKVDPTLYRRMIGSLLYFTASRPDICYSVGVCAMYQGNPMESHVLAVKRIICYVNETLEYGLWYSRETNSHLLCFSDADLAVNADDRKSTSGGYFFLGNNLVSWHSKKQNSISLSTTEVEYIVVGSCCSQLLWMKHMLVDYGISMDTLTVFCDNTSVTP
ncbi:secreted RxLR effector protein 161-like [Humulus lupulus]|uniref:secreted RxLR effector protein 161-like n=1 Tax=Humulus lupulus TaxID=3486 RepID=UPI002B417032|nr:secreted RxLR effector protein 161-like [Humulus lupulus]